MLKLPARRPSPALAISIVALFVALGGSAFAASKVGTRDIKNRAVSAAKLKANAVTTPKIERDAVGGGKVKDAAIGTNKLKDDAVSTAKIKRDAVTGANVNESTLGTVPSADTATTATLAASAATANQAEHAATANQAEHATSATNWSRYGTSGLRTANTGQTIELAAVGPFTFYGRCLDAGGPIREAEAYVTTSAAESFMTSGAEAHVEAEFDPGVEAKLAENVNFNFPLWDGHDGPGWTVTSPDGSLMLRGHVSRGVYVFGADCAYRLSWLDES